MDWDRIDRTLARIWDAEKDGTAPSRADDPARDYDDPGDPDFDGDFDTWAAPCEQCHYTKGKHADGCPDGDDDDAGYEIAKDREIELALGKAMGL